MHMWVNYNVSNIWLYYYLKTQYAHTYLDRYYYVGIMSRRTIKRKLVLQKVHFQIEFLYK